MSKETASSIFFPEGEIGKGKKEKGEKEDKKQGTKVNWNLRLMKTRKRKRSNKKEKGERKMRK